MLCPMGYWPAAVDVNGGLYETDRTFELPFMPDAEDPICQFCPNVGCFIVRRTVIKPPGATGVSGTIPPSMSATENTNPVASTIAIGSGSSESTEGEMIDTTPETGSVAANETEQEPDYKLFMSCNHWDRLPHPTEIVSYLDCVMIGKRDEFYLFIYEPRFRPDPLPTVDCVDANFLQWIPNGTQLLGLELGFRMKAIPPFLFRYHQRIMLVSGKILGFGRSDFSYFVFISQSFVNRKKYISVAMKNTSRGKLMIMWKYISHRRYWSGQRDLCERPWCLLSR